MSSRKHLFESDDFDKKKKLFTPSDFDKVSESEDVVHPKTGKGNPQEGSTIEHRESNPQKKLWITGLLKKAWHWIRPRILVIGIILGILVIGIIVYMLFSNSDDKSVSSPEQAIETVSDSLVPSETIIYEDVDIEEGATYNGNEIVNNPEDQSPEIIETPSIVDNTSYVSSSTSTNVLNVSNDVEAEAMKVIRGDYGLGQERKDKLGSKYQSIQNRVNELKREGVF